MYYTTILQGMSTYFRRLGVVKSCLGKAGPKNPAPAIVNSLLFRNCFRTREIRRFEAEFDIKLFVLGKLDPFNETD